MFHIVWIPKYRKKILYGECRREIVELIRSLVEKKPGLEIVEGRVCVDHVHLCLRIPPKYAVSDIVGYIKGKSALIIHDRHPEWRSRSGRDKTLWARGYYVSTVGLNEATIKQYIKNQEDGSKIG